MGGLITWVIAVPIIGVGVYTLIKSIKKSVTGGGCDGCTGCSSEDSGKCNH